MIVYSCCPEVCKNILPKSHIHIPHSKTKSMEQIHSIYISYNISNNNIKYVIRKGYVNMKYVRIHLTLTCLLLGHLRKANYH